MVNLFLIETGGVFLKKPNNTSLEQVHKCDDFSTNLYYILAFLNVKLPHCISEYHIYLGLKLSLLYSCQNDHNLLYEMS